MTFDYKKGEDYVCVLCGETKHTAGPRPDKLCDGCWELSARIRMRPDLAKEVLEDLEDEAFSKYLEEHPEMTEDAKYLASLSEVEFLPGGTAIVTFTDVEPTE